MLIAAWSGPRNLSTAMMYAFAARGDCEVRDEPFYAPFLKRTGLCHPMREKILEHHDTHPERVAETLRNGHMPHTYLKLMAHHMDGMPLHWAEAARHIHLIRHPARVIASYLAKREHPSLADIGFREQSDLYVQFPGPVLDSADIRADPSGMLQRVCIALDLAFTPKMLSWAAGGHDSDGIWAEHWYGAVHNSTGFAGSEDPLPELDGDAARLCAEALPHYEKMYSDRLV